MRRVIPLHPLLSRSLNLFFRGRLVSPLCVVLLMAAGIPQAGYAFPTSAPLEGPTGLGLIPTTDTVPDDLAEIGIGYESIDLDAGGHARFSPTLTASSGQKHSEFGIGLHRESLRFTGLEADNDSFIFHAKYRLIGDNAEQQRGVAVAVGVQHLNLFDEDGNVTSLYAVGSYPILRRANGSARLRGHLGVIHNIVDLPGADDATRPMLGLDLSAGHGWTIAADYIAKDGDAAKQASIVARYQTRSSWGAQIGFASQGSDNDRKVFVGLTLRLKNQHNR